MDNATVHGLIALNNRFYAEHAASFSATRNAPWEGWTELVHELESQGWLKERQRASVLDLACGNLRFERFLAGALSEFDLRFDAVDSCAELACCAEDPHVTYRQLDILDALMRDRSEPFTFTDTPYDLVVCFGFMHHVPGTALRKRLLDALCDAAVPGGIIVISFWQFMNDERLARKAQTADASACTCPPFPGFSPAALESSDHFLGWQQDPAPLRYCHHFDKAEIDELVAYAEPRAFERVRWSADGASGTLNRYLMLERKP